MNNNFFIVVLSTALLSTLANSSSAEPPASCASKFVGKWSYPGGTTTVNPDGTANPVCTFCVAVQTWTCSGDTYIITGPSRYSSKLSADGKYLVGDMITATRVGGAVGSSNAQTGVDEKKKPIDTAFKVQRVNQEPKCLESGLGSSGIACEHGPEMTIVVKNNCDRPVKIRICSERSGTTPKCGGSARLIAPGETWPHHACRVTGKYSVASY
jgi:hypothetical protein